MFDHTKIAAIYADGETLNGQTVTVAGWARTIRDMKNFGFVELNDGSCFKNLQVVLDAAALPCHVEIWGSDVSHDWYWWGKEFGLFAARIFG